MSGKVECDEVYVIAGHKGNPVAPKKNCRDVAIPLPKKNLLKSTFPQQ